MESHLNQLGREVASLQEGVQVKKIESKFLVSCIVAIKFCCFLPRVKFSASLTKTSGFSGAPLLGQKELADSCRQLLQVDQLVFSRFGGNLDIFTSGYDICNKLVGKYLIFIFYKSTDIFLFREGILSIEAAAHTFMDVSKLG